MERRAERSRSRRRSGSPSLRFALVLTLGGCAAPPPLACTSAVDGSGHGIPVCSAAGHVPACDAPGEIARFAGPGAGTLEGGTLALCDGSNEIVCSDRTVLPHCIERPPPD